MRVSSHGSKVAQPLTAARVRLMSRIVSRPLRSRHVRAPCSLLGIGALERHTKPPENLADLRRARSVGLEDFELDLALGILPFNEIRLRQPPRVDACLLDPGSYGLDAARRELGEGRGRCRFPFQERRERRVEGVGRTTIGEAL